jgi:WD40 repeat protein/DNA-binding SARP family transcriptional activator
MQAIDRYRSLVDDALVGIAVLGPLAISGDGGSLAPRDRVVLAALTVRHGEVVGAAVLADALWRDEPPATWSKQVQASVVRLRRALGAGAIETEADGYRLVVPGDEIDSHRFERLVARARGLVTVGASDRAADQLAEALALWRGAPLADLDGWEPGRIEAARLEELRLEAEEARLDAALRAGLHREVLAEAKARVAEQPLREHRWALLALAQYQSGQQADALRTIRALRQRLADEFGLAPAPALAPLEDAILQQDPSLAVTATLPPSDLCPYQGLVPYDVGDAEAFFGRDAELSACLRRLADDGVLVVVGSSGSGKSSLVRAGVAAALERDGRQVVVITPGAHPMSSLAVASSSQPTTVLVVDQCEEAVTLCADGAERSRFFTALADHVGPVVVALRADRLGDVAAHPKFAALVERGLYLLKSMDETGIRAAIEEPARRAGLLVEPGLVDLLVRDVEGEPGALPLLSHALLQTWAHREGRTLTVAGYQASGGIRGAVAQSAELVYETASSTQRPLLRDLMLRLVTPSPEGEPVRSRIPRRALAGDADREQVVELLVGARLVTSDEETVELAHEALARAWPRLRGWLDDDVDGQRILRHLSLAADTWDAMGRPDAELYRGVRLTRALEWQARAAANLNATERQFLDASQRHDLAQRQAARRRRRAVTTSLAAGVLVAVTLAAIALVNEGRASDAADRASAEAERANAEAERANAETERANDLAERASDEARRASDEADRASDEALRADEEARRARANALAASAITMLDDDPSLAKLLAVASAVASEATPATDAALHRAWAADRVTARPGVVHDTSSKTADIDPGGRRMVLGGAGPVAGSGKVVDVVDLVTDTTTWKFELDAGSAWVGTPMFAPDGRHVVGGVFWDPYNVERSPTLERGGTIEDPPADVVGLHLWDADTGALVERYDVGRCGGYPVAISATHVLAHTLHGSPDAVATCDWALGTIGVELVDRGNGERRQLSANSGRPPWGAAMSGDGTTVAYDDVGNEHQLVLVDASTGAERSRTTVAPEEPRGVRALNHDGSLLLYSDRPIRVWDVAAAEQVAAFDGHGGRSMFATFASESSIVRSTGIDGALRAWDALTGDEIRRYPGIAEGRVSATPDGIVLVIGAAGSNATPATLIDTRVRGEVGVVETCPGFVPADSLKVAGTTAVFDIDCEGDRSGTTHAVDLTTQRVLYTLAGHQAQALAVSPDGTRFVRQDGEGTLHGPLTVRDLRTGAEVVRLDGMCTWDQQSPVPPDDPHEGCERYPSTPFAMWAWRLKWSPDGTMIAAVTSPDIGFAVWDADTGAVRHIEPPDPTRQGIGDVIFTPDSSLLAVTTNDMSYFTMSTHTWEVESAGPANGSSIGLIGFTPDGSRLLVANQLMAATGGSLTWFDIAAEQPGLTRRDVHQGSLRSVALSADAALVATASSDGLVRVWDGTNLELVHEIPLGDRQIQGVAFVDDRHLAVTPQDGNLLLVTIDSDELLDIVRDSLTRGFTATECARFDFGGRCPTLSELRAPPDGPGSTAVLNGSYEVRWTKAEFDAELEAAGEPRAYGRATAHDYAGIYTVTFDDGRFDIVHTESGAYCTGSYSVTGDRVRMFGERTDTPIGCPPGRFLDATFDLSDHELVFDATTTHPVDAVLFAGQRLARVEG